MVVSLPFFVWGGGERTMSVGWPLNRTETLAVAALVVTALGAIPNWVNLLQTRGYDAAWLIPALQWVQRARWVIVALVASAVALLLVWKFRRQLVRLFKWLAGLRNRFYLWLLWHLVLRPARDHRGLIVSPDGEDRILEGMSDDALRLLSLVTARYVAERPATIDGRFRVEPNYWLPVRELRSLSEKEAILRQQRACEELLHQGFLTAPKAFEEHERSVLPRLPAWCTLGGGARRVLRAVTLELEEREGARDLRTLMELRVYDLEVLRDILREALISQSLKVTTSWRADIDPAPPGARLIGGSDPVSEALKEIASRGLVNVVCRVEELTRRKGVRVHVLFLDTDLDSLRQLERDVVRELEGRKAGES